LQIGSAQSSLAAYPTFLGLVQFQLILTKVGQLNLQGFGPLPRPAPYHHGTGHEVLMAPGFARTEPGGPSAARSRIKLERH
jgi:hypothetical protein